MALNLCGEFSNLNTKFRVWHPCHHDYGFATCPRLLQYQFTSYKSPYVTLERTLNLKNEKYLVATTKIDRFCINLNVYTWIVVFCVAPLKIVTSVGNIEKELKNVRITFVKHLQQSTSLTSLSSFKHLQKSPKF
jgi:hypothetical protein